MLFLFFPSLLAVERVGYRYGRSFAHRFNAVHGAEKSQDKTRNKSHKRHGNQLIDRGLVASEGVFQRFATVRYFSSQNDTK